MSQETPYETRYFSVLLNNSGEVVQTETSRIAAVDRATAIEYAQQAFQNKDSGGFIAGLRYMKYEEGNNFRITFLNCGKELQSFRSFLWISVGMSLCGLFIIFWVIFFCAGKIIRPAAESYEKQKRFITDAGHEIKTPITIINANIDLLEMELGENECLSDIHQQADRLTALTNDLVYLARMEEPENKVEMVEMPISDVISEAIVPFKAVAQGQGKEIRCSIEPLLSMKGNQKSMEQLISILMDNALKYSPSGEAVNVFFARQGKYLRLNVQNKTSDLVSTEDIPHLFERFYRTDQSRNSETGGYGIGLSVAKAIVTAHGGKIHAWTDNGSSFHITVSIPF
ncbi:MAG: HAMP domain-containing sensor histidine kinase [Clostridiales bacterium]|nr:HAMP domain-containing sensor histidine kinase [Clostridiales bacterium]